jgi:tripartite-type tricarboxylate transporter receptor subunit TctC
LYKKLLLSFLLLWSNLVFSASYPTYLGWPPGGPVDLSFRKFAEALATVDVNLSPTYKVGAGGTIAIKDFITSDANTLLWSSSGNIIVNNVIATNYSNTLADYRPVVLTSRTVPTLVLSSKSNKISKLSELFQPGCNKRLVVGVSSPTFILLGEILAKTSTCQVVLIKYAGEPATLPDLASGSIDLAWLLANTAQIARDSQNSKIIATSAAADDKHWGQYPKIVDYIPGVEIYTFFGLFASRKLTDENFSQLTLMIKKVWDQPEIRKKHVLNDGSVPQNVYGKDFEKLIIQQITSLRFVTKKLNLIESK